MGKEQEDFYKKLKNLLNDTSSWPTEYVYKLIYKSNPDNIKKLKKIFNEPDTVFSLKTSKNDKYTSVSVKIIAKNLASFFTPNYCCSFFKMACKLSMLS